VGVGVTVMREGPVEDATALVELEVRELVRRRGLDPTIEPSAVRALVEDVIADYEDRALSGPLPALGERKAVGRHVYDSVAGLGPLQRYLDDEGIEEIWIKGRLPCG
jgi:pilus assembly protein CpaF